MNSLVFSKAKSSLTNRPCAHWLQKFNPFIDENNLLRVGGHILNLSIPFDRKHPLLLPPHSRLTQLIIDHFHQVHLHPDPLTLQVNQSREYWIVSARKVLRCHLSHRITCFRTQPISYTQLLANLSKHRVSQLKPFLATGVDYGGPFLITPICSRGAKAHKSYIYTYSFVLRLSGAGARFIYRIVSSSFSQISRAPWPLYSFICTAIREQTSSEQRNTSRNYSTQYPH